MKIKLDVINNNILLFKFKRIGDISLTFFRPQEFYESRSDNFINKKFTVFDFIKENIDKHGIIPYFADWSGFNIPGKVYDEWISLFSHDELTEYEQMLSVLVNENKPKEGDYYIISSLEKDNETIDHEIAHALYYLNPEYRADMDVLTHHLELDWPDNKKRLSRYLKNLGYNKKVFNDEIQAYLATEKTARLKDPDDFGLKCNKKFMLYVEDYRTILKEYKNELDFRVVI